MKIIHVIFYKIIFIIFFFTSLNFGESIISGNITGTSGIYPIVINLYNESSWSKREYIEQQIIPINTESKSFNFVVTENEYGIVVIEDKDENGKMSFGLFGPSEPSKAYIPSPK
jgi:hypothetical protein